jgi:hypothetical protein
VKLSFLSRVPRNALALAAIAVVLPVILTTQILPNIQDRADAEASRPQLAPRGAAVEFAGLRWSLGSATKLSDPPGGKPLPPNTEAWVVTVDITKDGDPAADRGEHLTTCGVRLREGERYWVDPPIYWSPPRGSRNGCAGPGPLQTAFLVPSGIRPSSVDIVMPTRYPDYVRLTLD